MYRFRYWLFALHSQVSTSYGKTNRAIEVNADCVKIRFEFTAKRPDESIRIDMLAVISCGEPIGTLVLCIFAKLK